MRKTTFSISQALFSVLFLFLFFTLLNGYLQNIVGGYRSNTWLVLLGVVLALVLSLLAARGRVVVERNPLELAGFLLVVVGVWVYFVIPALPTLMPPTRSSDAVRIYQQVLFSYPEGKLVSWYPAGGAFLAAMFAHWINWPPLRVLHPTAASFIALSAGAVYGITCALLPRKRISKIAALLAPALLFVPWSYFAGMIDWEQYFYAQALAQLFILAALWYTASYAEQPGWVLAALIGAALLGTVAAYPIFIVMPLATFGLVMLARAAIVGQGTLRRRRTVEALAVLAVFVALMIAAALVLQNAGILELQAGGVSTTGDVGPGGVTNPSLDTLGGPFFLLLAFVGVFFAWRVDAKGQVLIGFLCVWFLELIALAVIQPYLDVSGYRIDKTFYVLVFPLAILATLPLARVIERAASRFDLSPRAAASGLVGAVLLTGVGVAVLRPPRSYSPFSETEIRTALWAKEHLDTYQISFLDPQMLRAYWVAYGFWRETLPTEWFQWIPAGTKLGPATFEEWLNDPAWPRWIFLPDLKAQSVAPAQVIYQDGAGGIAQKDPSTFAAPSPQYPLHWYFSYWIRMLGYDLPRTTLWPGETLTLTTYTEASSPPLWTVGWRVFLVDRDGQVVSRQDRDPFAGKYPVQRWPTNATARDVWSLPLNPSLSPGIYELKMGLYRTENGQETDVFLSDPVGGAIVLNKPLIYTGAAPLAKIKIPLAAPPAEELSAATQLGTRVGDDFSLSRYALQYDPAARSVHLTLYWQGLAKTEVDYTVFVHVLDAGGAVVAQEDASPLDGAYPTSIWDAQEIVKDPYALVIPADARGPFSIEIGMYTQPGLKRLRVGSEDHITLSNIDQ